MTHRATAGFWKRFDALPSDVQQRARKNHRLLEADASHPSLGFKRLVGINPPLWSVRVGLSYRALAMEKSGDFYWFWIGSHAEYDLLLSR